MGINFAPKWRDLLFCEEEATRDEDFEMFAALEAGHANEPRLPSGWWILPFATGGLIECYFVIDWIFGHL